MEREEKARSISEKWQANNLTLEGLKEVLKELGVSPSKQKPKGPSVDEVNEDWKRLATFMSKQG